MSMADARPGRRSPIVLLALAVAGYRFLIWQIWMRHVDKSGDEGFYLRGGQLISRWVRGRVEFDRTLDVLVGKGWFMPGMAIHSWPGRQFLASGSLTLEEIGNIRLMVGAFDFVLLCIVSVVIGRTFSRWIGVAFFAFIGFFPDAAFASFSMWGEAHGSKVLLLALLGVTTVVRTSRSIGPRMVLGVIGLGVLFAWAIYLRPPFLLQLGAAVVTFVIVALGRSAGSLSEDPPSRQRSLPPSQKRVAVLAAVVVPLVAIAMVLPWSRAISDRSGAFVLTTNTVDVNLIHAFSQPEDLEALTGGVEFTDIHDYAVAEAIASDRGYAVVLSEMRDELLADITFDHWLRSADREITRFYNEDESFLVNYEILVRNSASPDAPSGVTEQFEWIRLVNDVFWYPLAVLTVLGMFWRFPLWAAHGFPAITAKIAISALTVQPWVSNAKFRHLGAIIPTMALFALLVLAHAGRDLTSVIPTADERRAVREREAGNWSPWARWASTGVQAIAALMTGLAVLVYVT